MKNGVYPWTRFKTIEPDLKIDQHGGFNYEVLNLVQWGWRHGNGDGGAMG